MDYDIERTQLDNRIIHNGLIGKIFYHICPDDKRYFRTIRIHHNPFTNALQPQISNAVDGEPPPNLQPINPLMLNRLMRQQTMGCFH